MKWQVMQCSSGQCSAVQLSAVTDEPAAAQGADLAAPVIGEYHPLKGAGRGYVLLEGRNCIVHVC